MKKLVAGILTTSLSLSCLSCLTACQMPWDKTKYDVNGAANFLDMIYIDQIVDGREDYEVLNKVSYNETDYSITWSLENQTSDIVLVKGEQTTKVDVNEAATADVEYVLIATVSDPNGNTATVKFYATLLKAKNLIPTAITAAPEEGTAYKLYVYNNDSQKDLYFNGKTQATYYLATVEDYEDADCVDVYVEYVEGSETLFNLYFEHSLDGKQYVGIQENWNTKKGYWSYNPVIAGTPVSSFEYSTEYETIITTVPACSEDKEDATQDTTKTFYFSNSGGTYTSIGGTKIANFNKSGFVANLVTLESAANVSEADKIAFEKEAIVLQDTYTGSQEISVSTYGKHYPDVKISWEVVEGGNYISYNDGKLTVTAPASATTAKVKATLTVGETTETKEFTMTLKPEINVPSAGSTLTIPEAIALGNQFEKDTYTEGKYYVTGTIKSIIGAQYGNLYIQDEDGNEFYIYGLYDAEGTTRFDAMDPTPAVGDTITVYGVIGKYSSAQMKNGYMTAYTAGSGSTDTPVTPDVPEANTVLTVAQAIALGESHEHNTYTEGKYYVTGTVESITSTTYGNLYIQDTEGNKLLVYGLYDATGATRFDSMTTKPAVGDTITVYGVIGKFNTTAQMKNGWLKSPDSGSEEPEPTPTPETKTIAEIIAGEAGSYATAGTVVAINANGFLLQDATAAILVYTGFNWTCDVTIGDKLNLSGTTSVYGGATQFGTGATYTKDGTETVTYGEAKALTATECDAYASATTVTPVYVTVTGTLTTSTNSKGSTYYNLTIEGATIKGSITYPTSADQTTLNALVNKEIKVTGFVTGASATYLNIMMTAVEGVASTDPDAGTEDPDPTPTPEVPAADSVLTIAEAIALGEQFTQGNYTENKYYVTGTIASIASTTYGNLYIQDEDGKQFYVYGLYSEDGETRFDSMTTKPAVGDTITVYGVIGYYTSAQMKNGWMTAHTVAAPVETPEEGTKVSVSIATYADDNSWANGTRYTEIKIDDNITVTSSYTKGQGNTGKYYTTGEQWRIYQNEDPSVTIKAAEGKTIVSVKITYASNNNGVLTCNGENVASGATVTVNASEITFSVGNTGTATNGQAKITAIEVIYA